jgi:2-keto-4-pentenoate hydratase/2-oxohepta-3-ene-1,7-dioic acid hydratase in catechol pathway
VKLISFRLSTVIGPQVRIGAVGASGLFVDLDAAYRAYLVEQGLTPAAAIRIASAILPNNMVEFIGGGAMALQAAHEALDWAERSDRDASLGQIRFEPQEVVLLAPVPRPPVLRDFMAFETHLKNIYPKLGREIPPEWYTMPVYYKGNPGSIAGHEDEIPVPSYAHALDYEFEIAMVIGKSGRDIPRDRAMDHVFGFMIYNDFSARDIQSREMSVGLGPAKGKDFHKGHAFGPCLVTRDEIGNPYDLHMVSRINGQTRCDDSSGTMHWKFEDMIAHASMDEQIVTGEIFGTGTVGNGSGAELGEYLNRGDTIELEVEGLGLLRNRIV